MKRVAVGVMSGLSLLIPSSRAPAELVACGVDPNEECMKISLPCTEASVYGQAGWYGHTCAPEVIEIPNGRTVYAFLVNGFDQNHDLDMFHFYNFASCIFRQSVAGGERAYVHFAWWNNLLAPYMEGPLHNDASAPSSGGALNAIADYASHTYGTGAHPYPTKAIPAEDYQFQKDAKTVLETIREYNPDATIILVGHSMGGDAVIRLADSMPAEFVIDLLAPIDPVGNRTCLPDTAAVTRPADMEASNTTCHGAYAFTRFQATHEDWNWYPTRTTLEEGNVEYLYHRWQNEAAFPFDYGCPDIPLLCPHQAHMLTEPSDESDRPYRYLLRHHDGRGTGIGLGSINVQSSMPMNRESGTDVFPNWWYYWNWGGYSDGHGEIVGFRALAPNVVPPWSYPLALKARSGGVGPWPSLDSERSAPNPDAVRDYRVSILREWERDPEYLETNGWSPQPPPEAYCNARGFSQESDYCTYCMVSGDLCTILASTPVADAGPDQAVDVGGGSSVEVLLDASSSIDPNGIVLAYQWSWLEDGTPHHVDGKVARVYLPMGTHSITLTVDNGSYLDTDTVVVEVPEPRGDSLALAALAALVIVALRGRQPYMRIPRRDSIEDSPL